MGVEVRYDKALLQRIGSNLAILQYQSQLRLQTYTVCSIHRCMRYD